MPGEFRYTNLTPGAQLGNRVSATNTSFIVEALESGSALLSEDAMRMYLYASGVDVKGREVFESRSFGCCMNLPRREVLWGLLPRLRDIGGGGPRLIGHFLETLPYVVPNLGTREFAEVAMRSLMTPKSITYPTVDVVEDVSAALTKNPRGKVPARFLCPGDLAPASFLWDPKNFEFVNGVVGFSSEFRKNVLIPVAQRHTEKMEAAADTARSLLDCPANMKLIAPGTKLELPGFTAPVSTFDLTYADMLRLSMRTAVRDSSRPQPFELHQIEGFSGASQPLALAQVSALLRLNSTDRGLTCPA